MHLARRREPLTVDKLKEELKAHDLGLLAVPPYQALVVVLLDDGPLEQAGDCCPRVVFPAAQGAAAVRLVTADTCTGRAGSRACAAVVFSAVTSAVSSICLELDC